MTTTTQAGQSLYVAVMQENVNVHSYDTVKAFRVFGAGQQVADISTGATYWDQLATLTDADQAWDQRSDWNGFSGVLTNVASTYGINDAANTFKPSDVVQVTFNDLHTDPSNLVENNQGAHWGAGFTINLGSIELIQGVQVLQWAGSNINQQDQACQLVSHYIFCPFDSPSYLDGTAGVTIANFKTPYYWGELYSLSGLFSYAYSSKTGHLVVVQKETTSLGINSKLTGCSATSWSPAIKKSRKKQLIRF